MYFAGAEDTPLAPGPHRTSLSSTVPTEKEVWKGVL